MEKLSGTIMLACAGLAATQSRAAERKGDEKSRPNIIWLMAEDMSQDLECYGMAEVKTPVLDKLAGQGVLYMNARCTNPISSPSRSAMMTGVHQTQINAHNHRSNRDVPLKEGIFPITYHLRNHGYTCVLGNHGVMNRGRKTDCNFTHRPVGEWNGVDQFGLFDKFDEFTAEDQPFFAQIQLNVTHRGDWWKEVTASSKHPVDPDKVVMPPYMADHPRIREQWASYLDQVEYMDNEVGMLLKELEDKGMLENTVIFFIGDNGRCEIKGKGYLYEPGTRIPMIAWGKGITPAVVDDIVGTTDISATILDMAGVPLPEYLSGQPLFMDGKPAVDRDHFYSARDNWDEIIDCSRSITTDRFKYIRNYMPQYGWERHQTYLDFHRPAVHVMRTLKAEGKLNEDQLPFFADSRPEEELYDIIEDPYELRNLAADEAHAGTLAQMRAILAQRQARYPDDGIADMNDRNVGQGGEIRRWVREHHPEEWKKLTEGEICDSYQKWNDEANASRKSPKKNAEKR
jgi:arylsulfatase A-like enzyme